MVLDGKLNRGKRVEFEFVDCRLFGNEILQRRYKNGTWPTFLNKTFLIASLKFLTQPFFATAPLRPVQIPPCAKVRSKLDCVCVWNVQFCNVWLFHFGILAIQASKLKNAYNHVTFMSQAVDTSHLSKSTVVILGGAFEKWHLSG